MPRMHGREVRVYYGSRDASPDLSEVRAELSAATHDVTAFADGGWVRVDPGLRAWSCALTAYYDPAVGGVGRQFETLLGTVSGALTVADGGATAVGGRCPLVLPAGVLQQRGQPASVADIVRLTGAVTGVGRAGLHGVLLHPLAQETATGNGAAVDHGAATTAGGRANLHVTAVTAALAWTIIVQHSADGSTWADLITHTTVTGVTDESLEVSGTVQRHTRVRYVKTSGGNLTFVSAFARY